MEFAEIFLTEVARAAGFALLFEELGAMRGHSVAGTVKRCQRSPPWVQVR